MHYKPARARTALHITQFDKGAHTSEGHKLAEGAQTSEGHKLSKAPQTTERHKLSKEPLDSLGTLNARLSMPEGTLSTEHQTPQETVYTHNGEIWNRQHNLGTTE